MQYIHLSSQIYKDDNFKDYRRRVAFILRSLIHNTGMKKLIQFFHETSLRHEIAANYPFVYSQAIRPFFYRHATFLEKATIIKGHYLVCEKHFTEKALRSIYLDGGLPVWSTDYKGEELSLRLHFHDNQKKEGLAALELTLGDTTVYQVVFWISADKTGQETLCIGALQGLSGGAKIIRDLTKYFCGYRPKNFILHALRLLAKQLGIEQLRAVSNYGFYDSTLPPHKQKLKTSLDDFWQETGGSACSDSRFFQLPLAEYRKQLDDVESQKRNLYRKRFAMLDTIDTEITEALRQHIVR